MPRRSKLQSAFRCPNGCLIQVLTQTLDHMYVLMPGLRHCSLTSEVFNSDDNRKISAMIGALYVFSACERHSKLTGHMHIPLRPITKEDSLRRDISINWSTDRNLQIKVHDVWRVTHLNLLRQESVMRTSGGTDISLLFAAIEAQLS